MKTSKTPKKVAEEIKTSDNPKNAAGFGFITELMQLKD